MSQSVVDSPPPTKAEKKHKKDKKRSRDEADDEAPAVDVEDAPKKLKKSKSESLDTTEKESKKSKKSKKEDDTEEVVAQEEEQAPAKKEKKKKSKKNKEEPVVEEEEQVEEEAVASEPEVEKKSKKSKDKKEKKEKKDKKKQRQASATPEPETTTADDAMDIDTTTLPTGSSSNDDDFPFYTQTHSLYVPFYPCGFDKPLTNIAQQHLEPLLNHYSPVLRGVLLSYTNLNLSERPVQASVINPPTDETPALLRSVDEYAVGFAYLTFDAHMFKPARGKSMEGVIQMQSEGHIGVQCWGRFNASIEAKRLPKGWKWHDLKGDSHNSSRSHIHFDDEQQQQQEEEEEEEDQLDGEELQVVEQMHTTGYWTDASGKKISGKVQFRIKNFDVGLAGDYGYLSLEGTFLSDEEERALQKEEREMERKRRSRQNPGGLLRPMSRRVPEFSMTRFGKEEEEEDAGKRTVFAKVTGKEGDVTPDD